MRRSGARSSNGVASDALVAREYSYRVGRVLRKLAVDEAARLELASVQRPLEFRWRLRMVETVSGEHDGECSGTPRTVRVG